MPRDVMHTPRSVDIDITSRCNLRCRYCYYYGNSEVEYQDLQSKEWQAFFEELGRLSVMDVCLAGGEPFLRPDLKEILQGIVGNKMRFSILSNGSLIDDDIASFIASTKRCNQVQVSIDAATPGPHDACRGPGSFEGAVRGLRILQRHGVPVAVRVTVHKYNYKVIEGTARFLLNDLGLQSFGTNSAGYLGVCRSNAEDVQLGVTERIEAMRTLLRLAEMYPGRISAAAGPLAEGRIWREMDNARLEGRPIPGRGRLVGCGCTGSKIAVRSDGAIVPCNMVPHIVLGRINRDSLQEIWLSSPELNRMRARSSIDLKSFEHCRDCDYLQSCTGNCPGVGYNYTGDIYAPSPDACLRDFLAAGGMLP